MPTLEIAVQMEEELDTTACTHGNALWATDCHDCLRSFLARAHRAGVAKGMERAAKIADDHGRLGAYEQRGVTIHVAGDVAAAIRRAAEETRGDG